MIPIDTLLIAYEMYAPTADAFVAKIFQNGIADRLGWSTLR